MKKITSGFTLIEMIITVAIVAILAAIAYPSYQDSVRKSRRADAKAVLLNAAQWMERFYTENNRYDQNRAGTAVTDATQFPSSGLTKSPIEGGPAGGYYAITLEPAPPPPLPPLTQNTFTLIADPQATGGQKKDSCGKLTLTNTGAKGVLEAAAGATVTDCW